MRRGPFVIRVFVVAEIRLYREGLEHVLGRTERIEVVGTAAGREAVGAAIEATRPDIVLLDMATPESFDVVPDIREIADPPKIVALAVPNAEGDLLACAEAGIAGYVTRDDSLDTMIDAIEAVARGELRCTPRLAAALFERVSALSSSTREPMPEDRLTPREREIVGLIDDGYSNKAIALRLHIELPTVKNHVHNILEKLQVRGRGEAAARIRGARGNLRPPTA